LDLNQIATLVAVVEAQSFTVAARRLAVPVSTVSRSVSRLEAELGVRLIERTTRALRLTDAGRSYHERVKGTVTELAEASACASEMAQELVGPIRISGPPVPDRSWPNPWRRS
jgi:DNA-binding transcriptional LysR family regulator